MDNEITEVLDGDAINAFASFWTMRMTDLGKARDAALVDWCKKNTFTKEEFIAYKDGLATLLNVFMECARK